MNEQTFLRYHPVWPWSPAQMKLLVAKQSTAEQWWQSPDRSSAARPPPRVLPTLPPCPLQEDWGRHIFYYQARLFQCFWTLQHPISSVLSSWPSFRLWNSIIADRICVWLFFSCSLNKKIKSEWSCIYHLKIVLYLEREGVSYYWHLTFVEWTKSAEHWREHGIKEFLPGVCCGLN